MMTVILSSQARDGSSVVFGNETDGRAILASRFSSRWRGRFFITTIKELS